MKLNKNAQKWVDALRSGQFKQTKSALAKTRNGKTTVSYCCLGVACEVAMANGVKLTKTIASEVVFYGDKNERREDILPAKVRRWLGLRTSEGEYFFPTDFGKESTALTTQNDNGRRFKQIADIIESKPKGLFGKAKASNE